jgi:hypothetical protein
MKKGRRRDSAIDAAITNYAVALINYLDALSVNLFGRDLSSDNHEAAPPTPFSGDYWVNNNAKFID